MDLNDENEDLATMASIQNRYTFWYKGGSHQANKAAVVNYLDSIRKISSFQTVEHFWRIYDHLKRPNDFRVTTEYHLFKEGISPTWEDPQNKVGGKWMLKLKKGIASRYWEEIVLAIIGEQFDVGPEICGAVVSVRNSEDIISIWNKTAENTEAVNKIRDQIRRILKLPPIISIEYKRHSDSLTDKSSYRNPTMVWRANQNAPPHKYNRDNNNREGYNRDNNNNREGYNRDNNNNREGYNRDNNNNREGHRGGYFERASSDNTHHDSSTRPHTYSNRSYSDGRSDRSGSQDFTRSDRSGEARDNRGAWKTNRDDSANNPRTSNGSSAWGNKGSATTDHTRASGSSSASGWARGISVAPPAMSIPPPAAAVPAPITSPSSSGTAANTILQAINKPAAVKSLNPADSNVSKRSFVPAGTVAPPPTLIPPGGGGTSSGGSGGTIGEGSAGQGRSGAVENVWTRKAANKLSG